MKGLKTSISRLKLHSQSVTFHLLIFEIMFLFYKNKVKKLKFRCTFYQFRKSLQIISIKTTAFMLKLTVYNYWRDANNFLFVFVALRPMSTAMVIAGRSVHLTTLFPGQA